MIPVAEFYERCRPLLDETLASHRAAGGRKRSRSAVRHRRRQRVAAGLARAARRIRPQSEAQRIHSLGHRHRARHSGRRDFRLLLCAKCSRAISACGAKATRGRRMIFDPIFPRATRLPGAGEPPLSVRRRYQPVHNVGDFRYLEASQVGDDGQPSGDITVWDEILFPFDPALADARTLDQCAGRPFRPRGRSSRSRSITPATRRAWSR